MDETAKLSLQEIQAIEFSMLEFLDSVCAVSYTHLDVYKRQYYTKDGSRVKDDGDVSALQAETRTPVPTAGRRAPRGAQGSPVPAGGRGGFAKDPVAGRGRRA